MKEVLRVCKVHGPLTEDDVKIDKKPNGRISRRCHKCKKEAGQKWKEANRDKHRATASTARNANRAKVNAYIKEDRKKNPEKYKKWNKEYRDKNREKIRMQEICRIHGLTISEYLGMREKQNDKCAICGESESRKGKSGDLMPLTVDHCHDSETKGIYKVRGLLCHFCNVAIGMFKDDINLLKSAINYLKRYKT